MGLNIFYTVIVRGDWRILIAFMGQMFCIVVGITFSQFLCNLIAIPLNDLMKSTDNTYADKMLLGLYINVVIVTLMSSCLFPYIYNIVVSRKMQKKESVS